tara:strand:+ start:8430 stop:8657 length:228 start_codon:yes stop_codon:yes gene_type:complete
MKDYEFDDIATGYTHQFPSDSHIDDDADDDGSIQTTILRKITTTEMEEENGRANSELEAENAWLRHAEDNPSLGN